MSYITEADATIYFGTRLYTDAWDDANSADRVKALEMSTRLIDSLNYLGEKTVETQINEFPREEETVVPDPIQEACAEIALKLLDGMEIDEEIENLGVVSQGYSSVRTTYNRGFILEHLRAGIPSIDAWKKIKPYLADPGGVALYRV